MVKLKLRLMSSVTTFYLWGFSSMNVTTKHRCCCSSYLKVVSEDVLGQSVIVFMVPAEHLPALASKAQSVDHTCFKVARQYVISRKRKRF